MRKPADWLRFMGSLFLVAGFALLTGRGLYAQVDTGTILGTVKDQSGAVIPNAKVTLTNEGTTLSIVTTTGGDGTYVFTPIRIGTYTVAAEAQGFQKVTRPHITVNVQQQLVVDFEMVPGQIVQTVEVTAAPPLLQTQNGSVGQVVNSRAVNELPLNGRNFTFLAQLTAGVTFMQSEGRGLNASGSFVANGARAAQNNYLLDGIDNNIDVVDFLNGTMFVVKPSVDAIQEFKVQTNAYNAEIGRAGGAVLNATIKSGTNSFHGDGWEFLRNDKLDAADFFENKGNRKKGEFRQNQFGFTAGGPVYIPRLYNGKNKTFWFFDYEGTRIRQGIPKVTTVPTVAERNGLNQCLSAGLPGNCFVDFSDLISGQSGTRGPDALGRTVPNGTVFDPATTRQVSFLVLDPVSSIKGVCPPASLKDPTRPNNDPNNCNLAPGTPVGFVRDPFLGNKIPSNRLDPNVINLMGLYPLPTNPLVTFDNFTTNPVKKQNANTFDVRIDQNFSERDTLFARVSYDDEPQFKPAPFEGLLDGGEFNDGNQVATSRNAALSWTHSFGPTTINEARFGFSGIHTGRLNPFGNDLSNIPAKFGIQGVPQDPGNGGLPEISIGRLARVGGKAFLISDEFNSTAQATENLTRIYKSHTFKGGFEFQHIKFSTLQPPFARGAYNFGGAYTGIPNIGDDSTGRVQALLNPTKATVPNGVDNLGGPNSVRISNIANVDNGHNYYGLYFQDDWKVTPKLTLNLGLRWDHFGIVEENFGGHANFLPGAPGAGAKYLIPIQRITKQPLPLSPGFLSTLAKDGIQLVLTPNFALGQAQNTNFAPRIGFAYQYSPKLVVRGGYGFFYGGFENRGFSPNIGENYPFQFDFNFFSQNDQSLNVLPDGSSSTWERSLAAIPLDPTRIKGAGLSLRGIQFNYITPYTMGYNLTTQYQLTSDMTLSVGYVASIARHLEVHPGMNVVTQILPVGTNRRTGELPDKSFLPTSPLPFPDIGEGPSYTQTEGDSYYHSLQVTLERRFAAGLYFLGAYTYSKGMSDAADLLNGGSVGLRAPTLPGWGVKRDYGRADFDVRNAFHFSGGYELPVGRGKHFLPNAGGVANQILGGWSTNWILTLQDGQPQTVGCRTATTSGFGCVAFLVPGQSVIAGPHDVSHYYNADAFVNPPKAKTAGQTDFTPLGGQRAQVIGPGFHRLDFSLFKQFRTSEKTHLEFRAEFFNLANHPNFGQPGSFDFKDTTNFSKITSTRDNPNDPRQIQFALKFYW